MNSVDKVLKIAKDELGYLEKRSNKSLASKTANAGKSNYTKYGKWIGANGDYWCASFLSWIFYIAYGKEEGKKLLCGSFSAACETIRQNFIKKKQYHTSKPKVGDVIFFKGSRHAGANHIGIVTAIKSNMVFTIEGNTSGASGVVDNGGGVAAKSYTVSNSRILGYGRPAYSEKADKPKTEAKTSKTYPKCSQGYTSITDALKSVGVKDVSLNARKAIAEVNGFKNYNGSASDNIKMLNLLKAGKLIKG